MVPKAGLEPARLAPAGPQDSVSTNFTTSAEKFKNPLPYSVTLGTSSCDGAAGAPGTTGTSLATGTSGTTCDRGRLGRLHQGLGFIALHRKIGQRETGRRRKGLQGFRLSGSESWRHHAHQIRSQTRPSRTRPPCLHPCHAKMVLNPTKPIARNRCTTTNTDSITKPQKSTICRRANRQKIFCLQRGTTDESAVDIGLGHKLTG